MINRAYLTGFLSAALILGACAPRVEPPERVSEPPEDPDASVIQTISIPSLTDDADIRLADYQGKVVLVNFWATWCAPCRAEAPRLAELYEDFRDQDFVLIGMTLDEGSRSRVQRKIEPFDLPYPVGLADRSVQEAVGGIRVVPTKILIDRNGEVYQTILGARPAPELRAMVQSLVSR